MNLTSIFIWRRVSFKISTHCFRTGKVEVEGVCCMLCVVWGVPAAVSSGNGSNQYTKGAAENKRGITDWQEPNAGDGNEM